MVKYTAMNSRQIQTGLPNQVRALWFVCRCFGICEKDLPNISRVTLSRAFADEKISSEKLQEIQRGLETCLFERFRSSRAPVSSTNSLTDEIVSSLLSLYMRILPRLDTRNVSKKKALWLVLEHVVVPTIFAVMVRLRDLGTGTEFHGTESWYLPTQTQKPIQRVLDYWLRTAGLITAHGVSKRFDKKHQKTEPRATATPPDSLKRRVQRWLSGEVKPLLNELHRFVDEIGKEVSWLDSPSAWKARLTLAYAIQTACEEADHFFSGARQTPSMQLAEIYRKEVNAPALCDGQKILTQPHTYFAARLHQQHLDKTGQLKTIVASVPSHLSAQFGPEVSTNEIRDWQQEADWKMNPGNWLLAFHEREAQRAGRVGSEPSVENHVRLGEYIFDLGVRELSRLMKRK
jgi:hypothetical protein